MKCEIDAKEFGKELVLKLKTKRMTQWNVRWWLMKELISLAAWIGWVEYEEKE